MKRRYFCQKMRSDSLVVRNSKNMESFIFRTTSAGTGSEGVDTYLNSVQVGNLIGLLQTWVGARREVDSPPLWEDIK